MKNSDVVIVGGGAVGCATAYFLAKAGAKVTVLEKEKVAYGASGFAMGLLSPLYGLGIPGPLEGLSLEGFLMHRELAPELLESTGIDYHAHAQDSIYLAFSDEEAEGLKGIASYSGGCGRSVLPLVGRLGGQGRRAEGVPGGAAWHVDRGHVAVRCGPLH